MAVGKYSKLSERRARLILCVPRSTVRDQEVPQADEVPLCQACWRLPTCMAAMATELYSICCWLRAGKQRNPRYVASEPKKG